MKNMQKFAIMPSSHVFGGYKDFPLDVWSTVYSKQLNGNTSWEPYEVTIALYRIENSSSSSESDILFSLPTSCVVDSFTILLFDVLWPVKMAFTSHT